MDKIIFVGLFTFAVMSALVLIYALCKISADADKRAGYDLEGVE